MLVKLAEAIGRISLAGRELTRLAGFTERVNQLITVLDDLNNGKYQRTMINSSMTDEERTNHKNISSDNSYKPNNGKIIYKDNIIR